MLEQTKILGRIREALRISAHKPGTPHGQEHLHEVAHSHGGGACGSGATQVGAWLPYVGEGEAAWMEAFAKQSAELKSDFRQVADAQAALAAVQEIAREEGWERVATHEAELTTPLAKGLGLPLLVSDAGYQAVELEKCAAGITECDVLVAQTGSVVITSRSAGGRGISVLPPHHVVLARRSQMVRDLPAAFAHLKATYGSAYPSFMSVITGPSRTGDIERILVLGAHGPKKLTILCW